MNSSLQGSLTLVGELMAQASQSTSDFAARSGLNCPPGCGACCQNHEVHVTVLDCLPLAFDLIERGTAEQEIDRIDGESSEICPFYFSHGSNRGRCTEYQLRPVLCRLFGFAAVMNKHGEAEMAMCKILKSQPSAEAATDLAGSAPKYIEYGHRLLAIDPSYGTELLPIRLAMRKAIEKALLTNQYSQMGTR